MNKKESESSIPKVLIQKSFTKYIIEGDYVNSIRVYRKALEDKNKPPFCFTWTIIEIALIKTGAIAKVTLDKNDNLSSKSSKKLRNLSDAQLIKAFTLIHNFVKVHQRFSVSDYECYIEEQMMKEKPVVEQDNDKNILENQDISKEVEIHKLSKKVNFKKKDIEKENIEKKNIEEESIEEVNIEKENIEKEKVEKEKVEKENVEKENVKNENKNELESNIPKVLIQESFTKYIIEGDYVNSIRVYRKALEDKNKPPFCFTWTIIEIALIKTGAIAKVTLDKNDNLSSKSSKKLRNLSDAQLIKAFTLIHNFVKVHQRFSVSDYECYIEEQIVEEKESRNYKKQKISYNV
eukprot:jgi/Orpsp1_1/1185984/evm.model.c7180000096320.2